MKLHYMGKYNLDPDSLPHGDHMPGAVQFKEAGSSGELGVLANVLCIVIMVISRTNCSMRSVSDGTSICIQI